MTSSNVTTILRSGERSLTLEQLSERAARAARGLLDLGVMQGDGIGVLLRNDFAFFEAAIAARLSGACAVPINWHFSGDETRYILQDSGARVLVVHADLLPAVADHIPAEVTVLVVPTPPELTHAFGVPAETCGVAPNQIDWNVWLQRYQPLMPAADPPGTTMLYTSGTTGRPKGVRREPVDDASLLNFYRSIAPTFAIEPGMRTVITGPLYHSAPLAYASIGLRLGCDLLLMPRFEPEALLALIERERISHMHMVPTMFVRLLRLPEATRRRYDVASLRGVIHGAAPCPIEIKRQMIDWWGPVIYEYYGSTEGSLITGVSSVEWLAKPGSVGRARPDTRIEIHDDRGKPLGAGEIGEIYSRVGRTPGFTYHRREADRQAIERNGLLTNGDVGYLDDEGYLYICDRKRDMIISGGVNIYPAEIESALLAHPQVADCAVFGIPDPEFGEAVAAAVEPVRGATLNAPGLRDFLAERIAGYKVPRDVVFHTSLPRLDNGKIYKRKLRAPYWQGAERQI